MRELTVLNQKTTERKVVETRVAVVRYLERDLYCSYLVELNNIECDIEDILVITSKGNGYALAEVEDILTVDKTELYDTIGERMSYTNENYEYINVKYTGNKAIQVVDDKEFKLQKQLAVIENEIIELNNEMQNNFAVLLFDDKKRNEYKQRYSDLLSQKEKLLQA